MSHHRFKPITYNGLNSRQKENFNFHKVAARLADYGFNSLRLTDDWEGADFLACHIDGETVLKIQLKGRLTLDRKYIHKDIRIAFRLDEDCFLYPNDEVLDRVHGAGKMGDGGQSAHWETKGQWSWPRPPAWARDMLEDYRL